MTQMIRERDPREEYLRAFNIFDRGRKAKLVVMISCLLVENWESRLEKKRLKP